MIESDDLEIRPLISECTKLVMLEEPCSLLANYRPSAFYSSRVGAKTLAGWGKTGEISKGLLPRTTAAERAWKSETPEDVFGSADDHVSGKKMPRHLQENAFTLALKILA